MQATGQIVTISWHFENGYSKTDCESVEAVKGRTRLEVQVALREVETKAEGMASAAKAVKAARTQLESNWSFAAASEPIRH